MPDSKPMPGGPGDILRALDSGDPLPSAEDESGELPPIRRPALSPETKAERRRAELTALPRESQIRKAFELCMRGASVASVAGIFGVSESTVYRWKQERAAEFRNSMEQQSGIDLISETVLFYTFLEELCLFEIDQADRDDTEIDSKTGTVRGNRSNAKRVRQGWVDRAHGLRNSKTKLLFDVGIIRREPEKIFHTLRGDDLSGAKEDSRSEISTDELAKEIERLARFGRRV